MEIFDFFLEECGNDPHRTGTPVSFNCLNERQEFLMVGMVIHTILLVVREKALVGCHRGHHALNLGIVKAA